ncbi:hypothetical protein BHE74_00023290 [Ensete ventricosum]|nr:hypothetical protein GW17_00041305 [Ensete ventricosum]RWW69132.1 hypothetical protein BHE74_00023290 [Ensete ventricosum]RZR87501.1 hypothetical protein BHM03_00014923 [Ensete ventricosum]
MASRRAINPSRRVADSDSIPLVSSLSQKSRNSPLLSVGLVVLVRVSCTSDVLQAIPILRKAYSDGMRKVLYVGPDSCTVVSKLLKEEDTEAWGVEPYDLEDADNSCKSLVRKGFVRVSDIKFPLPYRPKSFSLVVVSDSLDYLSPKYLNKTLPDLSRVSTDGLVIFAVSFQLMIFVGYPGHQRVKVSELAKFGRPVCSPLIYSSVGIPHFAKLRSSSWWIRYFLQNGLEENETVVKKYEQASSKSSYKPSCQHFHINS